MKTIRLQWLSPLSIIFCAVILSAPAVGNPVPFQLELFNVDDTFTAFITNSSLTNQQILQTTFNNDSGLVDISSFVQPGPNTIHLSLDNISGGWTYGYDFRINGSTFASDSCGTVNVLGCNNNDQTPGIVFTHDIQFRGPVSGVPEPNSVWVAALGFLAVAVKRLRRN